MSSPRSGFRRAAVASWVLAGIGVAGVAGASQLAYAGTLKPIAEEQPAEEQPAEAAIPAPPAAPVDVPAPPAPRTPPAAQPAPEPILAAPPAPVRQAPVPVYTPPPTYAPAPQYTPPPAPVYVAPSAPVYVAPPAPAPVYVAPPAPVQQAPAAAPAPSQGGFPIRHSNTGIGGGGSSSGNKFTPSHTASRGS